VTSKLQHFLDSQLIDDIEVVSLTHWPLFIPGKFLVFISVRGSDNPRAVVRLEGLGQLNKRVNSSGIKPAAF
jgi:hypothetical protein